MTGRTEAAARLSELRALPDEEIGRHLPARRVFGARVREQLVALLEAELAVRAGREAGVHDARVACRRLVAALVTFRPVVDTEVGDPLRGELQWFARSLGAVRDRNVTRERLLHLAGLHLDEVTDDGWFLHQLGTRDGATHADRSLATDVLATSRYARLLAGMDALVDDHPGTAGPDHEAGPLLRRRIRSEWSRLAGQVNAMTEAAATPTDEQLHDVRKAAKRMRYALETAELLWLRKPRTLRKHVHQLSDILGEHQDTVITRVELRALAAQAERDGKPTVSHHRLQEVEDARATELRTEFRRTWSAAAEAGSRWP